MTIEMTSRRGPFENRPFWVEIAVTLALVMIIFLILQAVGVAVTALIPAAVAGMAFGSSMAWQRRRKGPNVRSISISDDLAERARAKIGNGTDDLRTREAIYLLRAEGVKRTDAELVVAHLVYEANPEKFGLLSGFFQTREVSQ